ncbi:unnamed protein product [Caenorhabditis nigoni]|uniref:Uncharacterized protein n=1 Tax=Caenorhabditis nigoni TaxID=1611254 RepID=A0A2G5SYD8_9PELO|nr:hypothetical protein B9Z55_025377 [Caenorhabditis nigoni]
MNQSHQTLVRLIQSSHVKLDELIEAFDNLRLIAININFARVLEEYRVEMAENMDPNELGDAEEEEDDVSEGEPVPKRPKLQENSN